MHTRTMTLCLASAIAAATVTLSAQQPQTTPTQPPDKQPPTITQTPTRAMPANPTVTITGCLKEEKDVPGLTPNVAERAGVTEDYILTEVKMSPSSSVSGIGVSTRYEVDGIAEVDLKKHLNQQVELTGQIVAPTTADKSDETPDFRATSIKMLAATCPAAQ
jgi:hypothetical protein